MRPPASTVIFCCLNDRLLKGAHNRWRPTPFLQLSVAGHVAAVAALVYQPSFHSVAFVGGVANHLLLIGAGLWPRSSVLGSNWTRLPESATATDSVALTFDDG